jgi:NAD-dependent deacetylase
MAANNDSEYRPALRPVNRNRMSWRQTRLTRKYCKITAVNADTIQTVHRWIDIAERVVVLTGAGISTDSGIPDFRGPQGLWTKNPAAEKMSDIRYYVADREVRKAAWQARLNSSAWNAKPNAGHLALAKLERRGKLQALITQNIDGLHQRAGNASERVIEVHGTLHKVVCLDCGWKGPMLETLDRVRAGEEDPACLLCNGMLKSDTISFGQALVPDVIQRALTAAQTTDLLLSIGTSLQVYPIASAVPYAKSTGARIVIMNAQPTPFDNIADAVFDGSISEILPRLV